MLIITVLVRMMFPLFGHEVTGFEGIQYSLLKLVCREYSNLPRAPPAQNFVFIHIGVSELTKAEFKSCTEYSWLKAEIKARTEQRIMPFWQVCLVVLACPGLVATVVLIVGVRMHVKDYRRYRDYVVRKKRQIATQRRRHHFRASGAVGDVLLNSSIKNSQK